MWRSRSFIRTSAAARPACLIACSALSAFVSPWIGEDAAAATISVTGTADSVAVDGNVTLREALLSINRGSDIDADVTGNRAGSYGTSDTIHFFIGSGAQTIRPVSGLPAILKPVLIDGTSQPGFAGVPLITLDGSASGTAANGLVIAEHTGSSVDSLEVAGFGHDGIWISANIFADGFNVPQPADLATRPALTRESLVSALHNASSASAASARRSEAPSTVFGASAPATTLNGVISSANGGVGLRVNAALNAATVEVSTNSGDGVWVDTTMPVTLTDIAIHNNGRNGVRVLRDSDSAGLLLNAASSGSMIHDNAGNGIVLGDQTAQTGAVNATVLSSLIYANQIGVQAQQRDAILTPTAASYDYNYIHGNRSSGLYFKSTFLRPATIGAMTLAPFSGNDVEHNAFPSGDTTCSSGETAAQMVFEGPVSVSAGVAAACAAAATADACASAATGACLFNSQGNAGLGLCAPAYPLLGGTPDACGLGITNLITGYVGDGASMQGPTVVGISAVQGAWVNARVNRWKHSILAFNIDYTSDASSFLDASSACPGAFICGQ